MDPPGFDGGNLIPGNKPHVVVDTLGLLLHALVTPAMCRPRWRRDGAVDLVRSVPFLKKLFADAGYAGPVLRDGQTAAMPHLITEIVR